MILAVWRAYSTTEFCLEPANSLTKLRTAHNRQLPTSSVYIPHKPPHLYDVRLHIIILQMEAA
jgi:hypothetical protein